MPIRNGWKSDSCLQLLQPQSSPHFVQYLLNLVFHLSLLQTMVVTSQVLSLNSFCTEIVSNIYCHHPIIPRLMAWQRRECRCSKGKCQNLLKVLNLTGFLMCCSITTSPHTVQLVCHLLSSFRVADYVVDWTC